MKNWFLYPFSVLFVFIITISILIGEDKAWVDCSNEDDLYRYINEDWKVDKQNKSIKLWLEVLFFRGSRIKFY